MKLRYLYLAIGVLCNASLVSCGDSFKEKTEIVACGISTNALTFGVSSTEVQTVDITSEAAWRAEIMKILVARRQTTVPLLAQELCVCCNTVRNDIHALALDYPLETCSGNGGGVRVADWYHPYKNMLTEEQSVALEQLLLFADIRQAEVIRQILAEFSSQTYRQKYAKE